MRPADTSAIHQKPSTDWQTFGGAIAENRVKYVRTTQVREHVRFLTESGHGEREEEEFAGRKVRSGEGPVGRLLAGREREPEIEAANLGSIYFNSGSIAASVPAAARGRPASKRSF